MFLAGLLLGLIIGANVSLILAALLCAAQNSEVADCLENRYDCNTTKAPLYTEQPCDSEACAL